MIDKIRLINFRNFKDIRLNTGNNLVILLGRNAVGKTSVLEAIYYLCTTKSHRTSNYLNLINYDSNYAKIIMSYNKSIYEVVINKNKKTCLINNKEINRLAFIGQVKIILFTPYDLNLVNGPKEEKRKFLDLNISLFDNKYLGYLLNYKKLLKKRNEVLKAKKTDYALLKVLTSSIKPYTLYINEARTRFINNLNKYLGKICLDLQVDSISLAPSISSFSYEENLKKDLFYKTTTSGPHRDGFSINIGEKDLKTFGSQGQIKLGVIALKLSLYEIMKENSKPILLLDDIFAELDSEKQIKLVNYLNNYQTFITTTSLAEIPSELLKKALIIELGKDDVNGRGN